MRILIVDDAKHFGLEIARALNAAELPEGCEVIALNFELPQDGSVPEWIELIQPGMQLVGRDGRSWINDDPAGVVASLNARGIDLVIDYEHSTEIKAPNGEEAPAAAWVKHGSYEVREGGAIWGRTEWTPRGSASVTNREYRYLSPVLIFERSTGRVRSLSSIGLVNKPNLYNHALNHEQSRKDKDMDKALLLALGLPETATLQQALNAIGALQTNLATANNRAENPGLDKFVPRADHDAVVLRATNAEQKLKDQDAATLETAINTEVDAALKAGKITPATVEYHRANCRQEKGLENFKAFVAAAPVVAAASGLDGKKIPGADATALNAEEQQVCDALGVTAKEYLDTAAV